MALATLAAAAACAPPTDRLLRVSPEDAPLIAEGESDGTVALVLHAGDLVTVARSVKPRLAWKGAVDGRLVERDAELVEVKRSASEGGSFAFRPDLGGEVAAAGAAWLCRRMGAGPDCESKLRRIDVDGATLGYVPCYAAACPVAFARGRRVTTTAIDGLAELRLITLGGERALLATTSIVHGANWTEGHALALHADATLRRAFEIKTSEVDSRYLRLHYVEGKLTIAPDHLEWNGVERWADARSGASLGSLPQREIYRLAQSAK